MKKIGILLLTLCLSVAKAEPITVVASFSILADVTRQIGKDKVNVIEMVGAEKDVHAFQPSPHHVKKIAGAQLVLMNGLGLEGWMNRMVKASGYKHKVVSVAEHLPSLLKDEKGSCHHSHADGHAHEHYDPHVWQDPILMKQYVHNIAQALAAVDPAHQTFYQNNAKAYQAQLEELNSWVEQALSSIPMAKRQVITSHNAFAYLGHRYKIQFMAPQGTSTDAEASAKDVAALIAYLRKTKVRALFIENTSSPRLMVALAKEANIKIGGKLYSDALAKAPPANTYLGMYRHNINMLLASLKQH